MITRLLKRHPNFVSCNKSQSRFVFEENKKRYVICVRKKPHPRSYDNVNWEFDESHCFETPLWFRKLHIEAETLYNEKHAIKETAGIILFYAAAAHEDGFAMDMENRKWFNKEADFITWRNEWKPTFQTLIPRFRKNGHNVRIVEENHYEFYFELDENNNI